MKKSFLMAALLLSLVAFGQDTIAPGPNAIASVSITSFFGEVPRYNLGYMHRISERVWIGGSAGYGSYSIVPHSASNDEDAPLYKGYRFYEIRPEVYIDMLPARPLRWLFSAEFFYIQHTDTFIDNYYSSESNGLVTFDSADYKRIKTGINLNFIRLINFTDNFGLAIKAGIGARFRKVSFTNVAENSDNINFDGGIDLTNADSYRREEGRKEGLNLNFDMWLFYRF